MRKEVKGKRQKRTWLDQGRSEGNDLVFVPRNGGDGVGKVSAVLGMTTSDQGNRYDEIRTCVCLT